MVVIADTSPLNYLILIDLVELLPKLYMSVVVPQAVHQELLATGASLPVRQWASNLPSWITVAEAPQMELQWPPELNAAEKAAITLALNTPHRLLIIDERAGTIFARSLGLETTGLLGVLDVAAELGHVSIADALTRLQATSFYCSKKLRDHLLLKDAERRAR